MHADWVAIYPAGCIEDQCCKCVTSSVYDLIMHVQNSGCGPHNPKSSPTVLGTISWLGRSQDTGGVKDVAWATWHLAQSKQGQG